MLTPSKSYAVKTNTPPEKEAMGFEVWGVGNHKPHTSNLIPYLNKNLQKSNPNAYAINPNNRIIPTICAYSMNLSEGLRPLIISYKVNST